MLRPASLISVMPGERSGSEKSGIDLGGRRVEASIGADRLCATVKNPAACCGRNLVNGLRIAGIRVPAEFQAVSCEHQANASIFHQAFQEPVLEGHEIYTD
jgi:hypothetical protein